MNKKQIFGGICTLFFIAYGILGVLGRGPISTNAVLATYIILYFGHVYVPSVFGVFDSTKKEEE